MAGKRRKGTGAAPSPLTSQNSVKAEEIISSNVDLLTEILLRLPAKSVLRFKCVAKQWRTIVSDPKFQTTHAKLNPTPVVSGQYVLSPTNQCFWTVRDLLPLPFESNRSLPSLSFLYSLGSDTKFIDSCNGLILCKLICESYVVCNPTTQSYKILPKPDLWADHSSFYLIAYFASKSVYKVVTATYLHGDRIEFHIYSSDIKAWKRVVASFTPSFSCLGKGTRAVYWDGAVHWMVGSKDVFHFRFDINEEKLEAIQVSTKPKLLGCCKVLYFGECGGRLLLIHASATTAMGFRILEMGKGCSGWTNKFSFKLRSAFPEAEDRLMIRNISLLCVKAGADEENDTTEIVLGGMGKVVSYNLEHETLKVLCSFPTSKSTTKYDKAFNYHGSLLML